MTKTVLGLALGLCATFVVVSTASADIWHVNENATTGGDGQSWENACQDLQPALDGAAADDEIWVATGTYYPSSAHGVGDGSPRYYHFRMKNGVSIIGGFQGNETAKNQRVPTYEPTVLSGDIGVSGDASDNCYHVFYHPSELGLDNTAVLEGVTITGGNADNEDDFHHNSGGGMLNWNASPILRNCIVINNEALIEGGGLNNSFTSSPTLINCTLFQNSAGSSGGGMSNSVSSSPAIINCLLWGNTAEHDGQIHNYTDTDNSPLISFSDIQDSGGSDAWDLKIGHDQGNNIDVDPLFVDQENSDIHLTHDSPCLDSGDNTAYPLLTGIDMDGEDRFTDGDGDRDPTVDMGADEYISSDADTLSDYEEVMVYGTNKDIADSDGDGLSDSREVILWGDQWDDDPDGDGLINILDPDSDNNGENDKESDFNSKGEDSGCFILSL